MATVFVADNNVGKSKRCAKLIARAGGIDRKPKEQKSLPSIPSIPGGTGTKKPKGSVVTPKEGKGDGIGRNPKDR